MLRFIAPAIAALALSQPALARDASRAPAAERLAGNYDRALTYVLIAALIAAIVIATVDDGTDDDETPASP